MLLVNLNQHAKEHATKRLQAQKDAEEAARIQRKQEEEQLIQRVKEAAKKSLPDILKAAEKAEHGNFYLYMLDAKDKKIYDRCRKKVKQAVSALFGPKAGIARDCDDKLELTWDGREMKDYVFRWDEVVTRGRNGFNGHDYACVCWYCEGF